MATSLCPCLDRRVLKPLDAGLTMGNARERDEEAANLIKDDKKPSYLLAQGRNHSPHFSSKFELASEVKSRNL